MNRLESMNSETTLSALVWTRAGFSTTTWRLVCRGRVFATFTFLDASRSRGVLRAAGGAWEIDQTFGGPAPRVAVREIESDRELAVFRPASTGRGRTDFAGGASFRWVRGASSTRPASIETLRGGPVATVSAPLGDGQGPVPVILAEGAADIPELMVLLGLGLYTAVRQQQGSLTTEDAPILEDTVVLTA
jgi:hypothetical protein